MAIVHLQHIGVAVENHDAARERLARLGFDTRDFRNDQGKGFQHDSRALLGNDCWLHVVHNWNPESRVNRFLRESGPGLEHIALQTDDIESDVRRLRDNGCPIFEDRIFDANDGFEAFVFPDDAIGFTVELIQPHPSSWQYPEDARKSPVSDPLGVFRIQHLGVAVRDLKRACARFEALFGLPARDFRSDQGKGYQLDARVLLGNDCWLHLVQNWNPESRVHQFLENHGEGLEHIALETRSIEPDVAWLREQGVPLFEDRIFDANDGFEAFIYPENGIGFTIELIQPHACSWGYPA